MAVAPAPHLGKQRLLRLTDDLCLFGKEIAKTGHPTELGRGGPGDITRVGEETSGRGPRRACQRSFVFVLIVVALGLRLFS